MPVLVGDRHGQAPGAGPVAMHMQLAKRRIPVEHHQRRHFVEVALEFFGGDVLDGVAARFAREQARAGEVGEDDGHGGIIPTSRASGNGYGVWGGRGTAAPMVPTRNDKAPPERGLVGSPAGAALRARCRRISRC